MPARPDERVSTRRRPSTPRSKILPIAPRGGRRARARTWPLGRLLGSSLLRLVRTQWPMALAVLLVGGGGTLGLALVFPGGTIATPLNAWQGWLLGWTAPLLAAWLTAAGGTGLWRHLRPDTRVPWLGIGGAALASAAIIGLAGLVSYAWPEELADEGEGGGVLGLALARPLGDALGSIGAGVLLALALVGSVLLALRIPPSRLAHAAGQAAIAAGRVGAALVRGLRAAWARRPDLLTAAGLSTAFRPAREAGTRELSGEIPEPVGDTREQSWRARDRGRGTRERARGSRGAEGGAPGVAAVAGPLAAPPPRSPWRLPPLGLLGLPSSPTVSGVDLRQRARIIEETLESFHIGARVVEINEGPTVTQFGIEPALGVTVSRITARTNDLALRLGATTLRVEAPVPGKRVVGIEVPNSASAVVTLREILAAPEFERLKSHLGLALGRDVAGRAVAGDLGRMPHLLIAGATGSGKSVCLNGIIACLLMQCTPDELQLLMVDPKMVELAPFEGIPHLRLPVVTEMDKVVGVLKWVLQEMERRYALFVKHGVRNLDSFNRAAASGRPAPAPADGKSELPPRPLPYLVLVIDELADLMMTAPDDVELSLTRLAQKARATGIHLIVATQRPSVDVVTGLIKANFPTRIAFAVTSQVDSRVILDAGGAEKLLGRGDMLYLPAESSKPLRVQGNYVSDAEIEALVAFWRKQGEARYDAAEVAAVEALGTARDDGGEGMFERAVEVAREHKRVSVSLLQRRLGIGYPRAARLMDTLAERGIVEAADDGRSWVAMLPDPESADLV